MTKRRTRIAPGIYDDAYGRAATVKVNPIPQKEKRFPPGTPLKQIKAWQDETRVALRKRAPRFRRGTLGADIRVYLARQKPNHIDERAYNQRVRDAEAWLPRFGQRIRLTITADEYTKQMLEWRESRSPGTCNHRRIALGHLYVTLDGKSEPNIVRDVIRFEEPDPKPRGLPLRVIDAVLDQMRLDTQTHARLRLMRWTGMRPSQEGRLRLTSFIGITGETTYPEILQIVRRTKAAIAASETADEDREIEIPHVVVPRGKKGKIVRVPLVSAEALLAARDFIRDCSTDAVLAGEPFGEWSQPSANRLLDNARLLAKGSDGKPLARFTLYQIKHSVGSRLRRFMDLADVQHVYGHVDSETSEIYAPPIPVKIAQGFRHLEVLPPPAPLKVVKKKPARAKASARRRSA